MAERDSRADEAAGFAWQVGIWDSMAAIYPHEIDRRFAPVIAATLARADLRPGQRVLDLGTGTGTVALAAAGRVGLTGRVLAVDPSAEMLAVAQARARALGVAGITWHEGRAERLPLPAESVDTVIASLCLMFAVDRAAAAQEIARVLRPGGRLVASAWGPPERCDLVLFQQTAARFAPPPVAGVGPGALAEPAPFVEQLRAAGIDATVEREPYSFELADFEAAWTIFGGVTAANLPLDRWREARTASRAALGWHDPATPRAFQNEAVFILGQRLL